MKRLVMLVGIVSVLLLLLTSCYVMSIRPTGTISLNLGGPSGRAIDPAAQVRVYLYTYSSSTGYGLYTFPSGKQYTEFSYGTGTQTLFGIPIGLWQVLVSVGRNGPSGTEAFYTDGYGASPVISVAGGANSSTSVTTKPAPFTYSTALAGKDLKSVLYDYNRSLTYEYPGVLAASATSLYEIDTSNSIGMVDLTTNQLNPVFGLPVGIQINSLSEGLWQYYGYGEWDRCVYINSTQGILPYSPVLEVSFNSSFSATLTDSSGNPLSIVDAAMVTVPGEVQDAAIYYRRAHDLGGVYLDATNNYPYDGESGAQWVKDPGFSSSTNNASVLAMAVNSMSSSYGYAYFATTAGAFRAHPSLVAYPNSSMTGNVVSFSGPNNERIQALAVDGADNIIYVGTASGAYYAELDEGSQTSVIIGSWTAIPAAKGDSIVSIKVDNSAYWVEMPISAAFRSRYNLYTLTAPPNAGGTSATYPFYSGLPGELNAMDFAQGILLVAGSSGLASVRVAETQMYY